MARLAADEVRLAGGGPHAVDIWPTANRLPANILRFYVQFSEPAEAVFDRAQLRLITATSALVPDAFLMLNEELWSPDGRRLTVLMEPGRIKRGMGSHLTHEPALVRGRSYRLEVATGGQVFFKVFGVLPPAMEPLLETQWHVSSCSVMVVGPALNALAIFHSSECADVVNVPGGNGAVADERSSAVGIWIGLPNDGQHLLSKSLLKHRDTLHSAAE